jgi:ribulose-5-phosphate 4-epimerase/fuculose-1-phosphate aldolase
VCDKLLKPIYGAFDPRGLQLALDGIPTYPRSILVSTPELGTDFAGVMGEANACLMRGHGIATAGSSVEEAALNAIALNELAVMNYEAHLLGEPRDISDEDKVYFQRRNAMRGQSAGASGKPGAQAAAAWKLLVASMAE